MKAQRILELCQPLEKRLDVRLFGVYRDPASGQYFREDGTPATANDFKTVGGALKTAAVVGGGGAAVLGARSGIRSVKARYGADQITDPTKAGLATMRGVSRDVSAAGSSAVAGVKDALGNFKKVAGKAKPGILARLGSLTAKFAK